METLKSKLKDKKAETLVETLLALLIITLVITSFAEVIANLAKTNNKIKNNRTNLNFDGSVPASSKTWTVSISGKNITSKAISGIVGYEDNGLYYYGYQKTN